MELHLSVLPSGSCTVAGRFRWASPHAECCDPSWSWSVRGCPLQAREGGPHFLSQLRCIFSLGSPTILDHKLLSLVASMNRLKSENNSGQGALGAGIVLFLDYRRRSGPQQSDYLSVRVSTSIRCWWDFDSRLWMSRVLACSLAAKSAQVSIDLSLAKGTRSSIWTLWPNFLWSSGRLSQLSEVVGWSQVIEGAWPDSSFLWFRSDS